MTGGDAVKEAVSAKPVDVLILIERYASAGIITTAMCTGRRLQIE